MKEGKGYVKDHRGGEDNRFGTKQPTDALGGKRSSAAGVSSLRPGGEKGCVEKNIMAYDNRQKEKKS